MARNYDAIPLAPSGCCPPCPPPAPISPIISVSSVNGQTGDIVLKNLKIGDKTYNGGDEILIEAADLGLEKAFVYNTQVSTKAEVLARLQDASVGDVFFCAEDKNFYISVGEGEHKTFPSTEIDLSLYAKVIETGNKISVEVDPDAFTITTSLYNKNDTLLSTSTVDLPIENLVKDGRYEKETKTIILVLQNGTEIRVPIGDLVSGLVTTTQLAEEIVDLKQWVEDKHYLTEHQDISGKQDKITDLDAIRDGAGKGATAVQPAAITDMATKTWVEDKHYLTEHQDISGKQDKLTAGTNITIDNNVISANVQVALESDFTVKYAIGSYVVDDVIPKGTTLLTIVKNMLSAAPAPTTTTLYYGATDNVPSSTTGLQTALGVTVDALKTGVDYTIKAGNPQTEEGQYPVMACSNKFSLTEWKNKASGISYMSLVKSVVSGEDVIYYIDNKVYNEDEGGEQYTFIFKEA